MTPSPTAAFGDAPGADLRRTPWYLREVPPPVAAAVVSPLVLFTMNRVVRWSTLACSAKRPRS